MDKNILCWMINGGFMVDKWMINGGFRVDLYG